MVNEFSSNKYKTNGYYYLSWLLCILILLKLKNTLPNLRLQKVNAINEFLNSQERISGNMKTKINECDEEEILQHWKFRRT